MPKVKLTDAAVQRYRAPPGRRVEYFDALLPGFALRVAGPTKRAPEGRKNWVLFYRHAGAQKRLTLPLPYPALTLADARRHAAEAIEMLSRGVDPAARRAEAAAEAALPVQAFAEVTETYLLTGMKGRKGKPLSDRYRAETRRNFENHVLPAWKGRAFGSISRRDVITMLDGVAAGSSGKLRKGGPIAANRVLAATRAMFSWAIRRDIVQVNPCSLVELPGQETKRQRTLLDAELALIWPAAGALGYPFGTFFRLALASLQRRTEIAGMRWSELDIPGRAWVIPAHRTKTGLHDHLVPLSALMVELLSAVPRKAVVVDGVSSASPFVLTTDGRVPISGYSGAKRDLDALLAGGAVGDRREPIEPWRIHDCRRTGATGMGRLGVGGEVIGRVLNHAPRGITDTTYNLWRYQPEKLDALERWGTHLAELATRENGAAPHAGVPERRA